MAADYKTKYLDLRSKFLESSDVAYRLGYGDGLKEGAQAAQQQAQMEEQQAQMMAAQGGMPPGAEGGMPEQMPGEEGATDMAAPQSGPEDDAGMGEGEASELDSHIGELENLVAKGEKPSVLDMRKAVEKISSMRKSQKTIKEKGERNSTAQKRVVNNILKKWENETKDVTDGLEDILKTHGIKLED